MKKLLVMALCVLAGCSLGSKYKAAKNDTAQDLEMKERLLEHDNRVELLTTENQQKIEDIKNTACLEYQRQKNAVDLEHEKQSQEVFPTRWFTIGGLVLFTAISTIGALTKNYVKAIGMAAGIAFPLIGVGQAVGKYPNAIIYGGLAFLAISVCLCIWDFVMSRKNRLLNADLGKVQSVANALSQAVEVTDATEVKSRIKENKKLAAEVEAVCRQAIDEVQSIKLS